MPIEDQIGKDLNRSPALLDSAISQRLCSFSPVHLEAKTQFKRVNLLSVEAKTWGKDVCVCCFFLKDGSLSFLRVDTSLCRWGQRSYLTACSVSFEVSRQLKCFATLVESLLPRQTWRDVTISPQIRWCRKWRKKKGWICSLLKGDSDQRTCHKVHSRGSETRWRPTLVHSASPANWRLISVSEQRCFHFGD